MMTPREEHVDEKIRSLVPEVGIQLRSELDRAWQTLFSPRPDLRGAVVTAVAQLEGATGLLTQIAAGRWGQRAWEEIQKRTAELHGRNGKPGPGAVSPGYRNPSLGELMSVLRIAGMLPENLDKLLKKLLALRNRAGHNRVDQPITYEDAIETFEAILGVIEGYYGPRLPKVYARSAPRAAWNVPPYHADLFTGREELLQALHDGLRAGRQVALCGLPGVGKTLLAIEYAHRHRAEYQAVLWANADTRDSLQTDLTSIARLLGLPEQDEPDQSVVIEAAKRWFQESEGWLLILDNADDLAIVREFLPSGGRGAILLTTRSPNPMGIARRLAAEPMAEAEGALLLLRRAGLADTALESAGAEHRSAALAICREVGGLPLALEQAGGYIAATQSTPAEYLGLYCREGAALRAQGEAAELYERPPVTRTFSLAFQKVEAASPAAADLLRLCAFLAPGNVPEEVLTAAPASLMPDLGDNLGPAAANDLLRARAIQEASRYSLLRRDPEGRTLTVHRLAQEVLKDGMGREEWRLWAERAVRALERAYPEPDFANWTTCERLVPHALACTNRMDDPGMEFEEAGRLLHRTATYLFQRARYPEAEPLFKRSLAIREKALGPEHPHTAECLNDLGCNSARQGRYAEAEPLYQRATAIYEKALGPEHPNVVTSLSNLTVLYLGQGRYQEVEPLLKRVLAIREKVLEPEHADVATSLNNLAACYSKQGRYAEAEPLFERALRIREQVLGPEHPFVALALNNLATNYREQGRGAEAEPVFKRSLMIREKVLGSEHPDVAYSLNNLAVLYRDQAQYGEAEGLFRRALAIREKALGPDHPEVATVLENYALLLRQTGAVTEAEAMEASAAAIRAVQGG